MPTLLFSRVQHQSTTTLAGFALAKDHGTVFEGLIATAPIGVVRNNASNIARAEIVRGNYFSVLGVPAAAGRLLTPPDDATPGANPVAVLASTIGRHSSERSAVVGSTADARRAGTRAATNATTALRTG
jgi:hypothetical protein